MLRLIKFFSNKSALWKVNKLKGNYSKAESTIFKLTGKQKKLTKKDVIEIYGYSFFGIYSELATLLIILLSAFFLKILIPTIFILIPFTVLRLVLKGQHLNSFYKCLVFTISYVVITSFIVNLFIPSSLNLLLKIVIYISIGIVIELISLSKPFVFMLKYINNLKK